MNKPQHIKICILGSSGVGKTSLLRRFIQDEFEFHEPPTLGSAFQEKFFNYQERAYKFQMWDTAGQEKYAPLAHLYYREAEVAFLVYDITNQESFNSLKNWYAELIEKGPRNLIYCVIGNKSDLDDQIEVENCTARTFANSIHAMFCLTSAKENIGITDLFRKLCLHLQNQNPESSSSFSKSRVKRSSTLYIEEEKHKRKDKGKCPC